VGPSTCRASRLRGLHFSGPIAIRWIVAFVTRARGARLITYEPSRDRPAVARDPSSTAAGPG
jgi:hypothetical protein